LQTALQDTEAQIAQLKQKLVDMAADSVGAEQEALAIAQARAEALLTEAQSYTAAWARAVLIAGQVQAGTYAGPEYSNLTDDTVLYVNLAISQPAWATPDKLVTKIGHHSFFRAT
jgi:RES domain-containing protein